MADNVVLPGTGVSVASDEIAGVQHQYLKLELGADGVATKIEPGQQLMAASVPVAIASNQTAVPVSDNAGSLSVDDNAGSLTVDSPQLPAALGAGGGVKVDGSGTALPISAAALPLPAGAATQATLATLATEATLAAAEAHLGDIETAVELIDNAIAGTEMQVDVVTIAAGETHVGEMGLSTVEHTVTLTLDANVYHANDVLAATQELAAVARTTGGMVELVSMSVLDMDNNAAADMIFWFFDSNVALGAENAAVSITDGDAQRIIGRYTMASANFLSLVNSRCANAGNIGLLLKAAAGTTSIYMAVQTAGTPTQTANGIYVRLQFKRY